jgi:hypothetical protein
MTDQDHSLELLQQKEDERLLNLEMKQKLQDKQRQRWKTEVEIPSKFNVSENIDSEIYV